MNFREEEKRMNKYRKQGKPERWLRGWLRGWRMVRDEENELQNWQAHEDSI